MELTAAQCHNVTALAFDPLSREEKQSTEWLPQRLKPGIILSRLLRG